MKKRPKVIKLTLFALLLLFYSCSCDCTCENNLGCTILTVKQKSNGDTIQTKIYCGKMNYFPDTVLQDSIQAFFNLYNKDSTTVVRRDSIYKYDVVSNLSCNQSESYSNNGYSCNCSK